jgi:hypothetical protein
MSRTKKEVEQILEQVTAEIRHEELAPSVVESAAERVWARIANERAAAETGIAPVERIRSCADFQALIPAYLHGSLSDARALLLEDHTHECIPCRKALKQARLGGGAADETRPPAARQATSLQTTVIRWGIAAVLIIGIGLVLIPLLQRVMNSFGTLSVLVQAANGPVYRVADTSSRALAVGENLHKGERIRTAREAGAVVKLSDGSLIEMRERSEFSIADNPQGITIHLDRGQIIVQAAKQRSRRLYVATNDSLVSVTGTIFSVNSGTKGSRVSVIEGEVQVDHAGEKRVLRPGDQVSTHQSIERVPVQNEVAWSRDAERYNSLLAEMTRLRADLNQVPRPGVRYSTRLLDLAPEGTALYVALPNLSATLGEANKLLRERIQQNAELREWWEKEQTGRRGEAGFNQIIERIREFGAYLGPEIVISAGTDQRGEPGEPIVLAELSNAGGFRNYLDHQLAQLAVNSRKGPAVRLVEDPLTRAESLAGESKTDLFVWLHGDLLAATPGLASLQRLAARVTGAPAQRFVGTPFHARLAELYREGAGLIVAADLEKIVAGSLREGEASPSDARTAQTLKQLGILDLTHFIVELKESQGKPTNRAVVTFNEARGLTSWLAAPGPMGALEFISPDASIVAAFVVNQPATVVDDLLAALKTSDPALWQQLKDAETQHGISIRDDLAAPLGGEFAFAVDGPLLPLPSWKLVVEVYDTARLQQSFERIVEKLNLWAATQGKAGFRWQQETVGGRTFYALTSLDVGLGMHYTYVHGYLVAAASRALVERAIQYRESGYTVTNSARFRAALPEDGQANFSALIYQNLEPALESFARQMGRIAPEQQQSLRSLTAAAPALAYVYAYGDRIVLSANSEGGPIGLSPGNLLGLPGGFRLQELIKPAR